MSENRIAKRDFEGFCGLTPENMNPHEILCEHFWWMNNRNPLIQERPRQNHPYKQQHDGIPQIYLEVCGQAIPQTVITCEDRLAILRQANRLSGRF